MQTQISDQMAAAEIVIREVWKRNMVAEMSLIQGFLHKFPYISMDTEFPGVVFKPTHFIVKSNTDDLYALMKRNVDALCLIQLGLTLADAAGNLPEVDGSRCVWEFNFADFDSDSDLHNPESVSLLKRQGIDFSKNRRMGIDSRSFALLFKISGLDLKRNLTWITFHSAYDLGFMIKILTGEKLPDYLADFVALLQVHFGPHVYDLKPVGQAFGLYGGLDSMAKSLMVERAVGKSHQAGSDSLLTMQVFVKMIQKLGKANILQGFNYILFGLTSPKP